MTLTFSYVSKYVSLIGVSLVYATRQLSKSGDSLFCLSNYYSLNPLYQRTQVLNEDGAETVPSAGQLITITEHGLTLSTETFESNQPKDNCEDSSASVRIVQELIEVDQDLVPYQGDEEEGEDESSPYLVR